VSNSRDLQPFTVTGEEGKNRQPVNAQQTNGIFGRRSDPCPRRFTRTVAMSNFNGNNGSYNASQHQHHSGGSQGYLNQNQANPPVGRVAPQQSHVVNQPGSSGYAANVYGHQTNATAGNPSLASNQYGRLSGLQAVAQQQQAGQVQSQYAQAQGLRQPATGNALAGLAGQGQPMRQQASTTFGSPQQQIFA